MLIPIIDEAARKPPCFLTKEVGMGMLASLGFLYQTFTQRPAVRRGVDLILNRFQTSMNRECSYTKITVCLALLMFVGISKTVKGQSAAAYFYAIGDMPYQAGEVEKYENLIRYINTTSPLFTVHVGDTKSGHVDCSDTSYAVSRQYFNRFQQPLVYTPGDNEWTDCHKKDCGGYVAEERLSYLRKTIYLNPDQSFGKSPMLLNNQSNSKKFEKYVENAIWQQQDVLFCTVHVSGSSNNYHSKAGKQEFIEREQANLFWLDKAFELAEEKGTKGVVLFFHANIFDHDTHEGYKNIIASLKTHTKEFAKPVLAIYGDSHTFEIAKPLHHDGLLKNFTALQVFGTPDIYPVKIYIDAPSKDLFTIEPVYLY